MSIKTKNHKVDGIEHLALYLDGSRGSIRGSLWVPTEDYGDVIVYAHSVEGSYRREQDPSDPNVMQIVFESKDHFTRETALDGMLMSVRSRREIPAAAQVVSSH